MDHDEVRTRTRDLAARLERIDDAQGLKALAQEAVPFMIAYWDVHPHSAMEYLECFAKDLPLPLAHALVRKVVQGWKRKEGYRPDAGGSADHCYLSALILSENFDLADRPWVDKVLPGTLDKEQQYRKFERLRDGSLKKAIVDSLARGTRL